MKLAAYQFSVCGDIQHNLSVIKNAVHEAAGKAVDLIVFPECALTGYPPRDIGKSENVDTNAVSEALKELQKTADTSNIHIMLGTIACSDSDYYNRAYLLSPGQPPKWYGKRALYGWDEENFRPGAECGVFDIAGIRIGVRICFEVRFPEYFRELYLQNTDLNVVLFYDVSDAADDTRYRIILSHLITRAVENVTPVLSVNAISPNQTAPTCFINASGKICIELEKDREEMLIYNFEKQAPTFGELGRRRYSNLLLHADGGKNA